MYAFVKLCTAHTYPFQHITVHFCSQMYKPENLVHFDANSMAQHAGNVQQLLASTHLFWHRLNTTYNFELSPC